MFVYLDINLVSRTENGLPNRQVYLFPNELNKRVCVRYEKASS